MKRVNNKSAISFALALALLAGCVSSPTPKEHIEPTHLKAEDRAKRNREVFDSAWSLVNKHFFDSSFSGKDWSQLGNQYRDEAIAADNTNALYLSINKMMMELKVSHLGAAPSLNAQELLRKKGRPAEGAMVQTEGMMIQRIEQQRVVSSVTTNGSAAKAGVQIGWIGLTRSKGTATTDKVTYTFADQANSVHTLSIAPDPSDKDPLHRDVRELPNGNFYLRFDQFTMESIGWLSKQLKAHAAANGVVIDLRFNTGGSGMQTLVALAELFPEIVDIGTSVTRKGHSRPLNSIPWRSAHFTGQVAILTSKRSMSAAEVFSHVLQHHRRAIVIGHPTAGAVLASRLYKLPYGGLAQIPFEDYIGIDGERLEGKGIKPDIELPVPSLASLRSGTDAGIEAALKIIDRHTSNKAPAPNAAETQH